MLVPVMGIRPVGMNMFDFPVLMFVNVRLSNCFSVFMVMMKIIMTVRMRMDLLSMEMRVLMLFGTYKPDTSDRQHDRREHHPPDPFSEYEERRRRPNKRGEVEKDTGSERTQAFERDLMKNTRLMP